jgi:hypothetical protein
MASEEPEAQPSRDISHYWPRNIFIPNRMLPILPDHPVIRDITFTFLCGICCAPLALMLGQLNEYLGFLALVPFALSVCSLAYSQSAAVMNEAQAQSDYLT